eukprot:CAMPEP_0170464788 /NCGR_PEP_ID=MMETSP0123-20130129/9373_1 /TAXON_ID=182087 /ORGANISM="Favella ehrenbergii, Strain Fehren 1" /LENGTH=240 /DNA_ID=CAMNT_0010730517 /DNA_START=10 /DNA_END=728 /DNA_ORIENTATION=-
MTAFALYRANFLSTPLARCQGSVSEHGDYGGRLCTLNHIAAVKHLMSQLRDKETDTKTFRIYSDRIMRLLLEEALAQELTVETRQSPTADYYKHYRPHSDSDYAAVSIMRGGDSMLGELFNLLPDVAIGKVLIQRDESSTDKRPIFYYAKLPERIEEKKRVFVLDPMCASGGSAAMCIQKLIERGVSPDRITFINLVTVEKGIKKVMETFPEVTMITACIDPHLNEAAYICPGLGDFGDR